MHNTLIGGYFRNFENKFGETKNISTFVLTKLVLLCH
jgi:hypothetical protein